jgi:PAS domain S-box-containing protein
VKDSKHSAALVGPRRAAGRRTRPAEPAPTATDRDRTAQALAQSERRYRALVEHSLGLICAHDLTGQLLFVNPASARSLGYAPDDWVGRNLRDFIAPDAQVLFDDYLRRITARPVDAGLMRVVDHEGGERIWMYHNVRSEEPGEAPYVVGHALDITDRVLAEQAIRRNREHLRKAYRELDERVRYRTAELEATNAQLRAEIAERRRAEEMREQALMRERSTLAFLASASDQLTRALDHEATLTTLARLPVPFLADWTMLHIINDDGTVRCLGGRSCDAAHKPLFAQLLSLSSQPLDPDSLIAQAVRAREVQVVADPGAAFPHGLVGEGPHEPYLEALPAASAVLVPLVADEKVIGVLTLAAAATGRFLQADLAVLDDLVRRFRVAIAQVRLYREAQEANRLKDEFLATLSHELRTPLNAILGWARILRSRPLEEKADHAVQVIERNAEAQARLIEDVLDVSRIITGKLTLDVEAVYLPAVAAAALDSIRPAAHAKGIRLVEELEPTTPVSGDRHRLQQVVWNLLSNAVKFTGPEGTVTVSLRDIGDNVELAVSDTGVGIRREVLPFVFDRFRQADPSTTRSQGGLGLGLAIVRHLVELHGGGVKVRSVEGQGTTFTVELPARPSSALNAPAGQMVFGGGLLLGTPDLPLRGSRALVVDDHQDARDLAEAVLQAAGATVVTAASVPEALEAFNRGRIDVLVADIGLPGEDGYDLIRKVRRRPVEDGSPLVAIALTGYARAEDRDRALQAGFDRHIVKPAEPATLVMMIRELVER